MAVNENIKFERVAHFHAQHEYAEEGWQRNVSRGQVDADTTMYVAVPPKESTSAHLQDRLTVRNIDEETVRLEIPDRLSIVTVAILAQTALSEVAEERGGDLRIVAQVPFDLENPEVNLDRTEVYVDTLELRGDHFTEDKKFVYAGTVKESLGGANTTLSLRLAHRVMRSVYLPEVV